MLDKFFRKVFRNCGRKIQSFAKISLIVIIVAGILSSILFLSIIPLLRSILFILGSYISLLIIYGFGILVENAEENMLFRR